MPDPTSARSVKIDQDERGGWSSDRPRRDGAPPRPADLNVRNRVLRPSDQLRYSPASLLVIVAATPAEGDAFAERLVEDQAALLSMAKVRDLIAGRVPEAEAEEKAAALLAAAVAKRLEAGATVVIRTAGLEAEERERFVRVAAGFKRPCHLILIETPGDDVSDEDRPALNKLRTALDGGDLGAEGFATALRLGGNSAGEVKRLAFRPAPRDDD